MYKVVKYTAEVIRVRKKRIQVILSDEEYRAIKERAEKAGIALSAYVRSLILAALRTSAGNPDRAGTTTPPLGDQ